VFEAVPLGLLIGLNPESEECERKGLSLVTFALSPTFKKSMCSCASEANVEEKNDLLEGEDVAVFRAVTGLITNTKTTRKV
jgi:hypothetical protein